MANVILLATRSTDKAREIREILHGTPITIQTLDDACVEADSAEEGIECFDSFLENAHAKAEYFLRLTGLPTIADDSGISVDALDGAPGVRSRRFAQRSGLTGIDLDRANNERVLELLEGVPDDRRAAHYTCAAVFHLPDSRCFAAIGTCAGTIGRTPRGAGGFGYDPLFRVHGSDRTFGEVSAADKHRFSHRARAFRALAAIIDQHTLSR